MLQPHTFLLSAEQYQKVTDLSYELRISRSAVIRCLIDNARLTKAPTQQMAAEKLADV